MKKIIVCSVLMVACCVHGFSQQRINKRELELLTKNAKAANLLKDDNDFSASSAAKWSTEGAVILSQKTSFEFDKKGLSAGKRIGRNFWGLLFAIPTLGSSLLWANANNDTKILVEETERRKLLLNDKYAIEQYSVLYFRLSTEGDAFAARVIKKDGSVTDIDFADAVRVEDIRSVPDLFRSYTDEKFSSRYRPAFFKLPVSDLEEGDIVEYEFKNFNTQQYSNNPDYKEFSPVYYLCNRSMPVAKQVIEVVTENDNYYIGYKSLKGAPDFTQTGSSGKKVYRWEDNNRDKISDTRFLNRIMELPSVKFQVIYARNSSKNYIWFKNEADMKKDISTEELTEKAKQFWFHPDKLYNTGDYTAGLRSGISGTIKSMYKQMKKRGITEAADDDYVRKAYYSIRANTLYDNWSDYAFAKVFSGLLKEKNLDHEIIVTTSNQRTLLNKVAFTQEVGWIIKYKNGYYCNPDEHLNPEELPSYFAGNQAIRFTYDNEKSKAANDVLPAADTAVNSIATIIAATLEPVNKVNMTVEKTVEVKGCAKESVIDEALALTPYMENDFKNYDGLGMWEGMDSKSEEKAMSEFTQQKKEWKEEKPKMMKAVAQNDYDFSVESYGSFKLLQDGRSFKKRSLKFSENITFSEVTATAGNDIVLALPALISGQTKIKKEDRVRSLPADVIYPRTLSWTISMPVPAGYTVKGLDRLNKSISNDCGSFTTVAKADNNTITITVQKMYKLKNFEASQWPAMLAILDAAYNFSQSKLVLQKQQ
ncbi:DUF3857 domain-containing protein [Foetidibacter luteolus]|uniref:DUF3857 domain-containing protein n=1 Tax=Foetidibacter luteolus TaxID=2608880 RepID=UPI00129BA33C|nr:DUF3857 domain-containing protein [Foetidibacter luteolus]